MPQSVVIPVHWVGKAKKTVQPLGRIYLGQLVQLVETQGLQIGHPLVQWLLLLEACRLTLRLRQGRFERPHADFAWQRVVETLQQQLHGLRAAFQHLFLQCELHGRVVDVLNVDCNDGVLKGVRCKAAAAAKIIVGREASRAASQLAVHDERVEVVVLYHCKSVRVARVGQPVPLLPDMELALPERSQAGHVHDLDVLCQKHAGSTVDGLIASPLASRDFLCFCHSCVQVFWPRRCAAQESYVHLALHVVRMRRHPSGICVVAGAVPGAIVRAVLVSLFEIRCIDVRKYFRLILLFMQTEKKR